MIRSAAAVLGVCILLVAFAGTQVSAGLYGSVGHTAIIAQNNFVVVEPHPLASPFPITRAYDFLNSMGANIHMEDTGTAIAEEPEIAIMTAQTGIKHLRDSMLIAFSNTADMITLNSTNGIQFDLITDPNESGAGEQSAVTAVGLPVVEAFEGDNECDASTQSGCGGVGGPYNFTEDNNQAELYAAMRGLSSQIAVLGPSNTIANGYYYDGDISAHLDFGVMHNYTSWRDEENSGWAGASWCDVYATMTFNICTAQYLDPNGPIVSTEGGWGDYGSTDAIVNYGGDTVGLVPSAVKADYVGRDFAFSWMSGVPRTYYFELGDDYGAPGYASHGLYDMNGVIKPAGTEVANIHAILADAGATAATFKPSDTVGISVGGYPTGTDSINGHTWSSYSFIVQKSDGSEYLVYWEGCEEFDGDSSTAETCATTNETVSFTHTPSSITNWTLNASGFGEASRSTISPSSSITVTFKPQLQILQLGTSALALPTQTPGPAVASPTPSPSPSPSPSPMPTTTAGAGEGVVGIAQSTSVVTSYSGNYAGVWDTYPGLTTAGGQPTTGDYMLVLGTSGNDELYPYYDIGDWKEWDTPTFSALDATDGPNAFFSPTYITGYTWGVFANATTTGSSGYLQWNEAAGGPWSLFGYDLTNVDPVSPLSGDSITDSGSGTTATCPTVTVPRTGSLVICTFGIPTSSSGSGLNNPPSVPAGWVFDGPSNALSSGFNVIYTFHRTATTTTTNQVIPAMTSTLSTSSQEWYAETLVVQPPS